MLYTTTGSPLGELLLVGDETALRGLHMQDGPRPVPVPPGWRRAPDAFAEAVEQLGEYFAGRLTEFDLPLEPGGSPFQRRVWDELGEIPYGETASYGEIARRIGRAQAARAVGAANGANPISIVIPCHRLVGSSGGLTGYGGGIERKQALLELEASVRAAL
ncbi:MAG TPA: methylated-DNA--[protein]-cysteine S-methyltransferase [Gaiellaceae bacterium]